MNDEDAEDWHFIPEHVGYNISGERIAGWSTKEEPENIVVIVKIYKEAERKNTITKMTELLLMRNYKKKVYIVDSEEYEKEMKKYIPDESKYNEFGQQEVYYEFIDLISGQFVPIKLIAYK